MTDHEKPTNELRLTEVVLYKHGLAHYRRRGTVEGTQATLSFRRGDMNAVLKSLTVLEHGAGSIHSVGFASANPLAGANETTIDLGVGEQALQAFVRDIRGQSVIVSYQQGEKARSLNGRVLGLDMNNSESDKLILLGVDGQVRLLRLTEISALRLSDVRINEELAGALDRVMSGDTRREFMIGLSEGSHDLEVSYTLPAPEWRLTYRAIAENNEDGESGELQLQGWAIVDNTLNEAWDGVRLKLVTGRPLEANAQLFDVPMPVAAPQPSPRMAKSRERGGQNYMAMAAVAEESDMDAAQRSFKPQAQGQDMGELFEFTVQEPVSLARGDAAMVPLLATNMSYQRELRLDTRAYRTPPHPIAALTFINSSGYTLDAGPVVLIENGVYKGEATLAYTRDNTDAAIAYAEEKAVAVSRSDQSRVEWGAVQLRKPDALRDTDAVVLAVQQRYDIQVMTLTIDNNSDQERTLTIETAPPAAHADYVQMEAPMVSNSLLSRWRISLPPRKTTRWVWQERVLNFEEVHVGDLTVRKVEAWRHGNLLDEALYDKLAQIARVQQALDTLMTRRGVIEQQMAAVNVQNEEARKTLAILTTEEADLRHELVAQLQAANTRSLSLSAEQNDLDQKLEAGRRRIQQLTRQLIQST